MNKMMRPHFIVQVCCPQLTVSCRLKQAVPNHTLHFNLEADLWRQTSVKRNSVSTSTSQCCSGGNNTHIHILQLSPSLSETLRAQKKLLYDYRQPPQEILSHS